MKKNYTDLKEVIVDKLKALQIDGEDVFVDVYNINPTSPKGFPCAAVIESLGEGEPIDTARNERVIEFKIKLIQEMGQLTPTEASAKRLEITDAVMKMFDEDLQLVVDDVDSVMTTNITPISFDEIIKDRTIFESEFLIQCIILFTNY